MSNKDCAVIIIDSGFSREATAKIRRLLGVYDLSSGLAMVGSPYLAPDSELVRELFCGDELNHGTIILEKLLAMDSELPVILVKAFEHGKRVNTGFADGRVVQDGWVEGYLFARDLAQKRGMTSVANLSFGGFSHAMDGTGYEAFVLERAASQLPAGHVLVAAAGPGDGRPIHAGLVLPGGASGAITGYLEGQAGYNFWVDRLSAITSQNQSSKDWFLEVFLGGQKVLEMDGKDLPDNFWNMRQQLTFSLEGRGELKLQLNNRSASEIRFDCYIDKNDVGQALFLDNLDNDLVCEPAVLSQVIAVGLAEGQYGSPVVKGISKPEIRVEGSGPISFRAPEIVFRVAQMLKAEPDLTTGDVRDRLISGN